MSGAVTISFKHNFETAHRLPFLGGKCANLHGHSWQARFKVSAYRNVTGMNAQGISTEYGLLKKLVRNWIDTRLDHGAMLGWEDPLLQPIMESGSKVFVFGSGELTVAGASGHYCKLPWPTVEATSRMLCEEIQFNLDAAFNSSLRVVQVEVIENPFSGENNATWTPTFDQEVVSDEAK